MHDLNISSFPTLITNRLMLRRLNEDDDRAIFELRSNNIVNQFIDRPTQVSITEARDFITFINNYIDTSNSNYWAITLKDNTNVVGTICLWNFSEDKTLAELGYELHPTYQGLGIMSEAITAVLNYAITTIHLKELDAFTHKENINSMKFLNKHGFVLNRNKFDLQDKNIIVYSLNPII